MGDEVPDIKDFSQGKEDQLQNASLALQIAIRRSRGAALINVGKLELTQGQLVQTLPDYYYVVSVEEILESGLRVPNDKTALAVTGYSDRFYQDREKENLIEAHIRSTATQRNLNMGEFSLVVLSDSMPNADVMHNASLPWFNGPFQGDESVWSVKPTEHGVELVQHRSETNRSTFERNWIDKQTTPLE